MVLPILYAITDRVLSGGRDHAALVTLLVSGGARLIQIREKTPRDRDHLDHVRRAVRAAGSGARILVNDRPDLALLAGAAGVHVGGEDLPPGAARALLGPDAIVGFSTHSVEEARRASSLPVDYVALGPIWPTDHASVSRPPLGPEAIARAAAACDRPIVAIGGIDPARAREALEAGAAAVAVLGDLMTAADIPARVAAYRALRG